MSTTAITQIAIFGIGFLAQGFFSARMLVQWILSERQRRVMTPSAFWIFSLAGAVLMFVYGGLRHDFSILLGQTISYYIYIWNLRIQGKWYWLNRWARYLVVLLPVLMGVGMLSGAHDFWHSLFHAQHLPMWLLLTGCIGQTIFGLRFVYQWWYSREHHESSLPRGFWIQSLVGSSIIAIYGIFRFDPVLIISQTVGLVIYIRNLMLDRHKEEAQG